MFLFCYDRWINVATTYLDIVLKFILHTLWMGNETDYMVYKTLIVYGKWKKFRKILSFTCLQMIFGYQVQH